MILILIESSKFLMRVSFEYVRAHYSLQSYTFFFKQRNLLCENENIYA